ncbi:hypothetical protein U2388_14960, partial [Listeria monocytogenes]
MLHDQNYRMDDLLMHLNPKDIDSCFWTIVVIWPSHFGIARDKRVANDSNEWVAPSVELELFLLQGLTGELHTMIRMRII